jgi:phage/plasmid-associated DNA primase
MLDKAADMSTAFRPRVKTDYVSKVMDYNFALPPAEKIEEVNRMFAQIHPDTSIRDFVLQWNAYCLTGDTKAQKFRENVGYLAANGKSSEQKIHKLSFPIYSMKFSKELFCEDYQKRHKEFIHLEENPIRYAYIEEMSSKRLDVDLIKDFVDGDCVTCEIMYGTSTYIPVQAKLNTTSNRDSNYASDKGMFRRGLKVDYQSKFGCVEDEANHRYLAEEDLHKKFDFDDEYKNAYFHVLLPHLNRYFANNRVLTIPQVVVDNFQDVASDNDVFVTAMEDLVVKTDNHGDRIHREDLTDAFQDKNLRINGKRLDQWTDILRNLKRCGYVYKRQMRAKRKWDDSKTQKGAIIGVAWLKVE